MSEQIAFINVRPVWARAALVVLAGLALAGAYYGVRWLLGNTMAETARDFDTAESAARLSPRDPLAHLMLARLHRVTFEPEELPESLRQYEQAAALAPNDYLIWMEMGRARAAAGDTEGGISALRRAVGLAPAYAQPRWHLGNQLMRAGRTDEAFEELRRAADADPTLRPQVFNLAWQVYNQDMPQVIAAIGNSPQARAQLVGVLVGRQRLDDALRLWASLSEAEKKEFASPAGEGLARALFDKKAYRAALQVQREMGAGDLEPGRVPNGSFESEIAPAGKKVFEWQVTPAAAAQVAIDPRTFHGGRRSLRISFNAAQQIDFKNVSALVVVEPSTRYRLTFYARAEDLKSASTPLVEVFDAAGDLSAALAASAPIAAGTSDWQQSSVEFTTGARTEAVLVRLNRTPCPEGVCPIFGRVWYDDFDLQRAGGRAAVSAR
jgi:hypothetical protein